MLENYLVFNLGGFEYASSLNKLPIILTAKKYISLNAIENLDKLKLPFEGAEITVIDLANMLERTHKKLTMESRILVGQLGDNFFGILADDVKEIIMIDTEEVKSKSDSNSQLIVGNLEYEDRLISVLDIDKVLLEALPNYFNNHKETANE